MNWDLLCRLKDGGGLRLKKAAVMNKAHLAKLAWRLITQSEATWAKIVRLKYGLEDGGSVVFNTVINDVEGSGVGFGFAS